MKLLFETSNNYAQFTITIEVNVQKLIFAWLETVAIVIEGGVNNVTG